MITRPQMLAIIITVLALVLIFSAIRGWGEEPSHAMREASDFERYLRDAG
jgi:hypothetical protein